MVNEINNEVTCVRKPTIYTEKPTVVDEVDFVMNDENMNAKPICQQKLENVNPPTYGMDLGFLHITWKEKRLLITMFNWKRKNTRNTTSKLLFMKKSN